MKSVGDLSEDLAVLEFGDFGDFDGLLGTAEGLAMFGDGAPSGSDEFEEHGQRGLPGAVACGAAVTQADGGEGRFDRVRGSHHASSVQRESRRRSAQTSTYSLSVSECFDHTS